MSKVFNTIMTILLILGILGIVLGITVGLYRNDQLAKLQTTAASGQDTGDQSVQDIQTDGKMDGITDILLNGNLHTILLGVGTFLTLIGVGLFLISVRKQIG